MIDTMFDTLTRRTAARISRRNSLLTLSGAGLAALAGSQSVQAKKKRSKKNNAKKARNLANKKCQQQADDCATTSAQLGFNAAQIACCEFLANCDSASYIQCLAAN
jgi:hypothetical protein